MKKNISIIKTEEGDFLYIVNVLITEQVDRLLAIMSPHSNLIFNKSEEGVLVISPKKRTNNIEETINDINLAIDLCFAVDSNSYIEVTYTKPTKNIPQENNVINDHLVDEECDEDMDNMIMNSIDDCETDEVMDYEQSLIPLDKDDDFYYKSVIEQIFAILIKRDGHTTTKDVKDFIIEHNLLENIKQDTVSAVIRDYVDKFKDTITSTTNGLYKTYYLK